MISKLDFKSGELGQNARKSSPVGIGGYEMTSHTNKSLLKVRWINFDPVQRPN
jgi:hypothetical protein